MTKIPLEDYTHEVRTLIEETYYSPTNGGVNDPYIGIDTKTLETALRILEKFDSQPNKREAIEFELYLRKPKAKPSGFQSTWGKEFIKEWKDMQESAKARKMRLG